MKIAHLSDIHLRHHLPGTAAVPERQSREMPDRLAQAIKAIAADQPDLLVITGDLLDYPLAALNDPDVLQQGEKDLRLVAEILETIDVPVSLVHGNHDHPVLVRSVFGHVPMTRTVADHYVLSFFDDEDIDNYPRRLGPMRQRFLDALADESSLPQIHIQHFVIWPRLNEEYPYTYRQGAWMRDQITDSGRVRLVLSGHYHKGVPMFQLNQTYFATVPAFSDPPHPYWLYEIKGDKVTCVERQMGS